MPVDSVLMMLWYGVLTPERIDSTEVSPVEVDASDRLEALKATFDEVDLNMFEVDVALPVHIDGCCCCCCFKPFPLGTDDCRRN